MGAQFTALKNDFVKTFQLSVVDANGQTPERHFSDGSGLTGQHCLGEMKAGAATAGCDL
jgi:hypothetical protein